MKIRPVASQGNTWSQVIICMMALHVIASSLLELMAFCLAGIWSSECEHCSDASDKDGQGSFVRKRAEVC